MQFTAAIAALIARGNLMPDAICQIENVWSASHVAAAHFLGEEPTPLYVAALHGGLSLQALTEEEQVAREQFLLAAINAGFSAEKANAIAFVVHSAVDPTTPEAKNVANVLETLSEKG